MTEDQLRELIIAEALATSYSAIGARTGVSRQYVHAVAWGRRPVSDSFAKALGWKRIESVAFVPLEGKG